ncbi:ATP-NAD kinase-like domain-containing protein [Parachaetomium inaequale]|uniref:ATP-NAD kinase-like domain-containing protein n=1 Tax=Parachaetomium inaequale TaxID=2588326 RepID=A0AAN6PD81_9PEZI|nr:ATP-NAD kinase-like domain-containing protein [Parachaetomium inaequale]
MADKTSPKRVSFEEPHHSSASDEDWNPVEVVFDESNPYRRKSSMVANDSVPPHLRRAPPPARRRTECLVHQFLANQRKAKGHLPTHRHHEHHGHDDHDDNDNHNRDDVSSEAGLDRPVDPKNGHADGPASHPRPSHKGDHDHDNKVDRQPEEDNEPYHPCATILRNSRAGSEVEEPEHDDDNEEEEATGSAASNSSGQGGQLDEKQWRRSMVAAPLPRTPSQLDRRSASIDAPNSRLLTKKQLSEMAWGVRELSRRLGSMRLKFRVKTIFLLTKIYDTELIAKTRELCRWLLDRERDVRYTVYVDGELKENKKFDVAALVEEVRRDYVASGEVSEEASWDVAKRLRYWDEGICRARPHTFDFVITLGGDGTVLYASWLFQRIVPPVLSFALGSLGFLTKFDFEDYQKTLTSGFSEGVTVSLRLRFEATVMRSQKTRSRLKQDGEHAENEVDGEHQGPPRDLVEELIGEEKDDEHTHRPDGTYEVLNEVVVDRGPNPTMSNVDIFGDDEHFTSVSADGICVSTPTGSTAYNLAAGGSLCHPENPVMLVTAICAHTLSFRPVILPDTIVLRIGVPYDARASSWASFDGRERLELAPGDYVTVSASRYPFACVQPHGRRSEDWINSISAKLGWNTRQRQKAYKAWEK